MGAPSLYADVSNIRAEAARLDFARVLWTLLGALPVAVFFLLRFLWMLPAFVWSSGVWGWRRADAIIKAREAAARGG